MFKFGTEGTRFTQVDPFEDTERFIHQEVAILPCWGFTQVDPFEDTESVGVLRSALGVGKVSLKSIRSRILKVNANFFLTRELARFTQVDPFEDTERRHKPANRPNRNKFHSSRSVRGY